MKLILYHNNNCSKSRMCKKKFLKKSNINFELREYLKDQMTKEEIKNILENLR